MSLSYTQKIKHTISVPFIYGAFFPIVFLDIGFEIYHRICFPLYGIPYVPRSRYIRIDRQKLSYLTPIQKFNCMYCGYANGVLHYTSQIAADTERYWCPIQHESTPDFEAPHHHTEFPEYGDKKGFEAKKRHNRRSY